MKMFHAALIAATMLVPAAATAVHAATPATALVVAENIDDIVSIDPAEAYEFSSGEYVTQTYDRLVQYDAPDVLKLAPGLASEWKVDDASKTITLRCATG
jgi:peptide/nickel transport system substrate-binding protein